MSKPSTAFTRLALGLLVISVTIACGSSDPVEPSGYVIAVTAQVTPGQSGTQGPFTFTGTITASGAAQVTYRWEVSNGDLQPVQSLQFGGTGGLSTTYTWAPSKCYGNDQTLWARLTVLSPNVTESPKVQFKRDCLPEFDLPDK